MAELSGTISSQLGFLYYYCSGTHMILHDRYLYLPLFFGFSWSDVS